MAALLISHQNALAPGARVSIRDEEWLIRRIDRTSSDSAVLRVFGLSPLAEGKEARFIDSIERENGEISIVDHSKTKAVADSSAFFCESRLLLESHIRLRHGKRLTQRRSDVNDRRAISDVRRFLKTYVMPLAEDPFHEFEDGWGIKFTVNDRIGRRQVTMMEEEEIADSSNENSPFTYQDDIDPEEMAGFSIHSR
jgi:hypothetical protein